MFAEILRFKGKQEKNDTVRRRLTSSNRAAILICLHFMRTTTQQTPLAINLASQEKTTKFFSSKETVQTFTGSI